MNQLHLLLRLTRQTVDERQADLGNVCRLRQQAETALMAHESRVAEEARFALGSPDTMAAFAGWAAHAARRGAELKTRHAEIDRLETAARDALRDAAADAKRVELAHDTAQRQARKAEVRQADLLADEQQILQRLMPAA